MSRRIPLEMISFVKTNYDRLGRNGCAKHLGVSPNRIKAIADAHGIKMTLKGRDDLYKRGIDIPNEKRKVNPEVFMNVTTPEAAYLLGFIWADGCVSRNGATTPTIVIVQTAKDMEDIKPTIGRTGDWRFCYPTKEAEHHQQREHAYTTNRVLADYLDSKGYATKSVGSAAAILATIPDHLKHYWWRGLFDGDGCLFLIKGQSKGVYWSITSGYGQDWSPLTDLCDKLRIEFTISRGIHPDEAKLKRHRRHSSFFIRRHKAVSAMMEYLYQGREQDGIGLERKWAVWNEFKAIRFASYNNRYPGIRPLANGGWECILLEGCGASSSSRIGVFPSEEEAYLAQRAKIKELGLTVNRERLWGLQHQAVP